jgi:hypothetical protein
VQETPNNSRSITTCSNRIVIPLSYQSAGLHLAGKGAAVILSTAAAISHSNSKGLQKYEAAKGYRAVPAKLRCRITLVNNKITPIGVYDIIFR